MIKRKTKLKPELLGGGQSIEELNHHQMAFHIHILLDIAQIISHPHCSQMGPHLGTRVPMGTFLGIWVPIGSPFYVLGPLFPLF